MVRKNSPPASPPAPPVPVGALDEARAAASAAAGQLAAAEAADPGAPGWGEAYAAALRASRVTARRVETIERQAAERVEAAGRRAATVKSAAAELKKMTTSLTASRDQLAAAAAEHLRALGVLASAAVAHNALLSASRDQVAALGLQVAGDDGEHKEGILDAGGLRAGLDWTPVSGAGLAAHACRQVFAGAGPAHPLAEVGKHVWRVHEIEARPDGLKVPTLADTGAVAPEAPRRVVVARPSAASMSAPVEGLDAGPVRRTR